jgi:DNA-binding Xre family transcriptional regulator
MTIKRVTRSANRTAEEAAHLRADRERYQRSKPTVEQLLAEGGSADTMLPGEFLTLQQLMIEMRLERERQHLALADVETRTGIDEAALSRLETGKQVNTTFETVGRILRALGKELVWSLRDLPPRAPV